jgi:hypothetical protein
MGTSAWGSVPEPLSKRFTAKQCRDRWYNYANPDLNHGPWTAEEDRQLTAWQNKFGKKWAKVKEKMPGRSGPMCKARWAELGGDGDAVVRGGGGGGGAGGKRGGGKRKNRRGDDYEEDEEEEEEGDALNDDEEFDTSANVQKKAKGARATVGGKQLPGQFEFDLGDEFDVADVADNDSSSVEGAAGLGIESAAFAQTDIFELGRGMTPYQGHVASSMFNSPFMASGMTPRPLSLHGSPGIMRLQQRQLFSPSVPEMTPVRPGDMANFSSPSMDPFFHPGAPPPPPEQLPQWMTPLRPANAVAHHAAAAPNQGPGFGGFARTAIVPVSNTRRRQLYAINQKFKSPAVGGAGGGVDSPVPAVAAPAAATAAATASVPQTSLADLPPVTLFNGGRHHPIQELLDLLRRNDALPVFDRAVNYVKKCKLEDAAARAELLTVADAASAAHEKPHLSVMSPGDALEAD